MCVGALLAGIVFFNVSLLELNAGIARTSERAAALKRQNASLRTQVAELGSSERIQETATARGFVLPSPGDVEYLRADPALDAERAAKTMTEPRPPEPVVEDAPTAVAPVAGVPATPVAPTTGEPAPAAPAPTAAAPTAAAPAPAAPTNSPEG